MMDVIQGRAYIENSPIPKRVIVLFSEAKSYSFNNSERMVVYLEEASNTVYTIPYKQFVGTHNDGDSPNFIRA